jgi:hypothetical protein
MLTELMKVYAFSEESKYSGDDYDLLESKILIFYDYCEKVGIRPEDYGSAYSLMLKGRAKDFFFQSITNKSFSFETMYRMTKETFETREKHQRYLTE